MVSLELALGPIALVRHLYLASQVSVKRRVMLLHLSVHTLEVTSA